MTRNIPSRSREWNARCSQSMRPEEAHCRIWAVASGATTFTDALSATRPGILPSATVPPPTTRQGRDSSFRKIGNIVFQYKREKPITRGTGDGLFRSFCSQCFRSESFPAPGCTHVQQHVQHRQRIEREAFIDSVYRRDSVPPCQCY